MEDVHQGGDGRPAVGALEGELAAGQRRHQAETLISAQGVVEFNGACFSAKLWCVKWLLRAKDRRNVPQDGEIWCYHGMLGRPTPSAQWAAESLGLFLLSKAAEAGREKRPGSMTKDSARWEETQALLQTCLNLLSKILLLWDRGEIKAQLVNAENYKIWFLIVKCFSTPQQWPW